MSQPTRLHGWDLATWQLAVEDPALNSTMVGVVEVAGPVSPAAILMRVGAAVALQPKLRSVIQQVDGHPCLVDQPDFDPRTCIRLVPESVPIERAVKALLKHRFTEGEPLWRLRIKPEPNRTLLIGALNHTISDGVGALNLMSGLLDNANNRKASESIASKPPEPSDNIRKMLQRLVTDPIGLASDSARVVRSALSLLDVGQASEVLTERSSTFDTKWLVVKPVDRSALRGAHHSLVAAACAALADHARNRNLNLEQVTVNVPVAMQSSGHNQVLVARIQIPVKSMADMAAESRSRLQEWRAQPALPLAQDFASLISLVPVDFVSKEIRRSDLTVSTLPPIPAGLTIDQRKVSAVLPLVPPIGAAANVTAIQVGDILLVGTSFDQAVLDEHWPGLLSAKLSQVLGGSVQPWK